MHQTTRYGTALCCSYMLFVEVLPLRSEDYLDGLVVPWVCFYAVSSLVRCILWHGAARCCMFTVLLLKVVQ